MGGYELPEVGELNSGPLEEQEVLLTPVAILWSHELICVPADLGPALCNMSTLPGFPCLLSLSTWCVLTSKPLRAVPRAFSPPN